MGNSGTSARLLTGLLAAQKFDTVLTGDNSLSKRPMERISEPLNKMNAKIFTSNGTMPLKIIGNDLIPKKFDLKIPSAQIKSGILLASLNTKGETLITENKVTRFAGTVVGNYIPYSSLRRQGIPGVLAPDDTAYETRSFVDEVLLIYKKSALDE